MSGRRRWAAGLSIGPTLLGALSLLFGGCDAPPPVRIEPSVVRVAPTDREVRIELVNDGPSDVQVSQLRIEGEDWTAFAIEGETNPDHVPAHDRVPLAVRVTRRAFARAGHGHGYASYRSGHAELAVDLDGATTHTPIEFQPAPALADAIWTALVSLVLLGLALLGAQTVRRGLLRRLPAPTAPTAPSTWSPSSPTTTAIGFGLLAAAWATMPVGDALCLDQLGAHVHLLDLAQCRRGLGGGPLALAAVDGGLALWWAALAGVFALAALGAGGRAHTGPGLSLAHSFGPLAVIALAAAGPAVVHGTLDPAAIVRAQLGQDHSAAVWGWGALSQPVACLLAMLALARLPALGPAGGAPEWLPASMLGLHGLAAACIVTLFFGGWTLPTVPTLSHLANALLGVAAFAVKVGVVSFVACRLAGRAKRSPPGRAPGSSPMTGGGEFAWLFALALANLGATIALSIA